MESQGCCHAAPAPSSERTPTGVRRVRGAGSMTTRDDSLEGTRGRALAVAEALRRRHDHLPPEELLEVVLLCQPESMAGGATLSAKQLRVVAQARLLITVARQAPGRPGD